MSRPTQLKSAYIKNPKIPMAISPGKYITKKKPIIINNAFSFINISLHFH